MDAFGYWRALTVPEVGDTRWVSHESAAASVTRVLPGLRKTLQHLRPDLSNDDRALADAYNTRSQLYGVFLLAVICPILKGFSRVMQSPSLCFADSVGIRDYYVERLKQVRNSPAAFSVYNACWDVMDRAGVPAAQPVAPPAGPPTTAGAAL